MRVFAVLTLALVGLALAAAPQRELQRARQELRGLAQALARDGVRLDFDHARVSNLRNDPDSADVEVYQMPGAGPWKWRVGLHFWLLRGRRKYTSLDLEAVSPENSLYRIRSIMISLDGRQTLPWVDVEGAPPGDCPAYRKAGQRIFARQLPATWDRRFWALLGLLPTLALGVFLTFSWAAKPERCLIWISCDGPRWWKCGVVFVAIFLLTYLNHRLASIEAASAANMYLVWVATACVIGAQLDARAGSGRLAQLFRRALVMTSLAMLVAVIFGILAPTYVDPFEYDVFFTGFLAASLIWVVAFGRPAG